MKLVIRFLVLIILGVWQVAYTATLLDGGNVTAALNAGSQQPSLQKADADDDVDDEEVEVGSSATSVKVPTVSTSTVVPKKSLELGKTASPAEEKNIYLNFENTSLINLVNYMAERKNINLIPDKGLEGAKVSLTTREPLTLEGAWSIFLTILEMSGFTIVQAGNVYKVVVKDKKLTEPLPVYVNTKTTDLPDSDLSIRYVVFLQNIQVTTIENLLKNMLSDKSDVYTHKEANGFVITDKAFNIKTAMKVIEHLDTIGQPETVVVMKLRESNAEDVQNLLNSLIKKPDGNPLARLLGKPAEGTTDYFPQGTRIIADKRTNSLILMGQADPIKKIEDFIVNHVDTNLKNAESPLHIYELQYTNPNSIAEILRAVTDIDQGPGQDAAKFGAVRGGVKYFKTMNFQPDQKGNRLLISCADKHDWQLIKKTIQDLDKPQPQVALEVLIVTVSSSDLEQIAGAMRNKKHGIFGNGIDIQTSPIAANPSLDANSTSLLGNLLPQLLTKQGAALLSFGKKLDVWAIFEMLKTRTSSTSLTQAFLTVANKTTAKLENGQTQYIIMNQTASTGIDGYSPVDAKQTVNITPQINLDGVVNLKINIDNKSFDSSSGVNSGATLDNNVDTTVTVADGQALVLCGSISSQLQEAKTKTPLLADIPVFGWFFKNHQITKQQNYQFIFIAPTIIKPRSAPGVELYTKMKLHAATKNIDDSVGAKKTADPVMNWFFDTTRQNYSDKIIDYASARYQPVGVDVKNDAYYRSNSTDEEGHFMDEKKAVASEFISNKTGVLVNGQEQLETSFATRESEQTTEPIKNREALKDFVAEKTLLEKQADVSDQKLDEKRLRLKNLVSTMVSKKREESLEQREQFKEFVAPAVDADGNDIPLIEERTQFKEFIAPLGTVGDLVTRVSS